MVKIISLVMLLFFAASCSTGQPINAKQEIGDIKITEIGADDSGEFCQDFSLNESGVQEYFKRARIFPLEQLHSNSDYLPCFVKGTLQRGQQACSFEIRAGATAELSCPEDKQYFYACDSCDNLFIAK